MSREKVLLTQPLRCGEFRARIFEFQADELTEAEREAFAAHRDGCRPCARSLALEDAWLAQLRARLPRAPVPAGLEERVRHALRREAPDPRRASRLAAMFWTLPVAASLLLVLVLWSALPRAERVEQQVTVVDFVCDRAGRSMTQQIACADPSHLNALKLAVGRYWSLGLDRDAARGLVVDRAMRGHRLLVRGELYPAIRTLSLIDYEDLGAEAAVTAALFAPHP